MTFFFCVRKILGFPHRKYYYFYCAPIFDLPTSWDAHIKNANKKSSQNFVATQRIEDHLKASENKKKKMLTFGGSSEKKKTTKDLVRQTKRDVSRSQRELDREKRKLDREEKKLIGEIKKMAKKDSSSKNVKILAKQLVQLRSQRDRLIAANANMSTIKNQATMMGTQATMTKALAQAGTAMKTANKVSVVLFVLFVCHVCLERECAWWCFVGGYH